MSRMGLMAKREEVRSRVAASGTNMRALPRRRRERTCARSRAAASVLGSHRRPGPRLVAHARHLGNLRLGMTGLTRSPVGPGSANDARAILVDRARSRHRTMVQFQASATATCVAAGSE